MAKEEANTKLTKPSSPLDKVPDYLREFDKEEGFEEVKPGEVKIPRLILAQKGHPQVDENEPNFIAGLKVGEYFNSITGQIYGAQIIILPLLKFGERIRFADKETGGGILCRSFDMIKGEGDPGGECAKCKYPAFGSAKGGTGKGTDCAEFKNFPAIVVDEKGRLDVANTVIVTMKSTHLVAAEQLISLSKFRSAPMYTGTYKMTSRPKKFAKGNAHVPVVENFGWVAPEDAAAAKAAYEFMKQVRAEGRLKFDEHDDDDEIPGDEAPPSGRREDPDAPGDARE